MFSTGTFNASKLKSQLRMASSQIQIASNRKTSLLKQNMREIAMFLNEDPPKEEKARLRTEAFIRDDNITHAYDILNLQCNLLVERVKLIEQSKSKKCPPDLLCCVATLIYAEPFVDIKEFSLIRKQLCAKYGKIFEEDALANKRSIVNGKIALLLSAHPLESHVIQNYMIQICKQFEVDWKPNFMIAQPPPSDPPPPSSSLIAPSSIPAVAVRATIIQHDGSGIGKSEWVDEYEFYNIQTVDDVAHATVEGSKSQQNWDGLDHKMIPATSETVVEAVLVNEQPMSKVQNSVSNKSITYVRSSSTDNNEKYDRGYLEHCPPATAPIDHMPTLTLPILESPKQQQKESENIANTEQNNGTSNFQNSIISVSKNTNKETIPAEELLNSAATYTDAIGHKMREQSLQKRLDNLQKGHKEREEKINSTEDCFQAQKKIHLDDKICETIDSSAEDEENEEGTKLVTGNIIENILPELTKREEEGRVVEKQEKIEAKENNLEERKEEGTTIKILDRESNDILLEQVNCVNKNESREQPIMETYMIEQLVNIHPSDHSFAENRNLQETGMVLGTEHHSLKIKNETLPVSSVTKNDMMDNDLSKRRQKQPESTSTINQNQHSTNLLLKEVKISIPPIAETTTTNTEVPATTASLQTKTSEITANTQAEIEMPSTRKEEEKKTHHMLATAAGVAGGIAGLVAPVVTVGVIAGMGSAMIAKKVGKKIKKQHKKNQDQLLKRNFNQGITSTATTVY